ncbi:unnamed protein product [Symbiodinium sp. KB8]|nr:unnamed protein product [Symbiodinium sp. KB8]
MTELSSLESIGNHIDEPWVLRSSSAVATWKNLDVVAVRLSEFASLYKKGAGFKAEQRAQAIIAAKQGKEETSSMFAKFIPSDKMLDIEAVPGGTDFMANVWHFGYAPKLAGCWLAPNAAAMCRVLVMGQVSIIAFELSNVVDVLGEVSCDSMSEALLSLDQSSPNWSRLKGRMIEMRAGDVLWVPQGWVICEEVAQSLLCYGVRKSVLINTDAAKSNYAAAAGLLKKVSIYGWSAATRGRRGQLQVPVMLRTILHWLSQRFRTGDRLQAPPVLPVTRDGPGLSFYSDAKAETGNAWVGGYLWDGHEALQWYALEVLEAWAPWAFIKKEAGKGQGHLTGGTDNQGNSYAVSKLMSTRFPLPLLLMELSETLRRGDLTLDLSWVPRERNQWADDLTNQEFGKFSMERRLALDGARIDWIVLGDLLGSASAFHAELTQAKEVKRKGNPEPSARGRKKAGDNVIVLEKGGNEVSLIRASSSPEKCTRQTRETQFARALQFRLLAEIGFARPLFFNLHPYYAYPASADNPADAPTRQFAELDRLGEVDKYRVLPQITGFFGIISSLFKRLWDQAEMHDTLATDDNFEIVAIYDQTCRSCGLINRLIIYMPAEGKQVRKMRIDHRVGDTAAKQEWQRPDKRQSEALGPVSDKRQKDEAARSLRCNQ